MRIVVWNCSKFFLTFNVIAPYRFNLKSKYYWLSHLEGLIEMRQRNYSLKVQTSCFAVQLQPFPLSPSAGLRRLHLHLLRPGDGGEDGGPGHLRPPLLPGRHLEPPGLLHRHGRVSDHPGSFAAVDRFVCLFVCWQRCFFLFEEIRRVLIAMGFHYMFCFLFFPFCFRIGSFQARHPVNVNWIPTRLFCYGKCTDSSTWLRHVSGQNGSRCIAALHIISIRRETSLLCLASIALRAASVVQQAGKRKRRFLKPPFGRRSD